MYSKDFYANPIVLGRPLNDAEREYHLDQNNVLNDFDERIPHYALSVLETNSTFVEIVDRNYPFRGLATIMGLIVMALGGSGGLMIAYAIKHIDPIPLGFVVAMVILAIPFFFAGLWLFTKENFVFTHYPIRLNRKNRMVYVWRKKGVLVVPWDKVFFFVREYKDTGLTNWDIRGNVLAADGVTVVDSFPLSSYESNVIEQVCGHFEYFRRYMEDGPAQPWRMLLGCLPLGTRRETWFEGWMRLTLMMHGSIIMQVLFQPILLPISFGRWLCMHTNRIPQWPADVVAQCMIEPNDPYCRTSGWQAPKGAKVPLAR